ncbi:hypothetical protein THAOC_12177 [Thalassiosira oceanica]|uniref:riboflavin kinase n=1 Tax=Thalassiosira oceanica TaxID=159749 RepID=K0T0N7_THAOC|nr:hypothetical protein THAOC_12177 [Thalassiosira oceanica]|eukprot:EJK66856.1 hypothetical protein THAOC_12177 [Thalassiosira oceanica]
MPSAGDLPRPIRVVSKVVRGFGRGSKELGIPTANVSGGGDDFACSIGEFASLPTGIYWGFGRVGEPLDDAEGESVIGRVLPAAISVGYNPHYKNKEKTVEPHLIVESQHPRRHASSTQETLLEDFYGESIVLSICGYIRAELPFEGVDKLIEAIKRDIKATETLAANCDAEAMAEKQWVASARKL